jgi:hypothetical protein
VAAGTPPDKDMLLSRHRSTGGGGPRRKSPLRILTVVVAALLVTAVTASGLLLYLLAQDGIGSDWLRARLEAAIEQRLPADIETNIGRVTLALRRDAGLVVAARQVSVRLPGGTRMEADAVTSTADPVALLRGEVDPTLLRIEGARIWLEGIAALPDGQPRADQVRGGARQFADAVEAVDAELRAAGFEELQIAEASIVMADPDLDLPVLRSFAHVLDASWMPLGDQRSKIWAQLSSEGRPWTLTVERQAQDDAARIVDVSFADLPVSDIAPIIGNPRERPYYGALATIRGRIELDDDGGFARLRGRASAGSGYLALSHEHTSVVEGVDMVFELGPADDRLLLHRLVLQAGQTIMSLTGSVGLAAPGEALAVSVGIGPGQLAARPGSPPVPVARGQFIGSVDPIGRALTIDSLEVAGPQGEATLAGSLTAGAGLALALSIDEMSAEMARALWPPMAAPKARRWFDEQVRTAIVGPGTLQIALPDIYLGPEGRGVVLPAYGLVGQLQFRDGSFSPFGRFPPISGAAGEVSFADAAAIVILQSGRFAMPGGTLAADGSIMVVPELGGPDPIGDLTLRLTGPAAALAELSDSDPLSVASAKGIAATGLTGGADLSLSARIPLDADADIAGLQPEFRLMLQGFASDGPIAGRAIAAADLVLQGHPEDYTIQGLAEIDGIAADVEMRTVAGEEDSAVALTLDRAARQRLGIDLDGIVDGVVVATLEEPESDGSRPVSLDLRSAGLDLPFVGWQKGPGVPARATFVLRHEGELIEVSSFSLVGDGFGAQGSFTFDQQAGRLRSLELSEVSLRPGDRFAVSLTHNGSGYDLSITGSALDARTLVSELQGSSQAGDGAPHPVNLSIRLDRVTALNGVVMRDVRGRAAVSGGRLREVALAGRTDAGEPFDWTVTEQNRQRRTYLRAANGGAILSGMGLYSRIAGGDLTLDLMGPAGSSSGRGLFVLNRFQIIDEAALADALAPAVASRASGRREVVHQVHQAEIDTRNMQFSTLQIPFQRQGDVVHIREAFLRGAMLGGTGSGTINLAERSISISGSLIPVFGINNIAGAIPLLGPILGGGRNEGLVGITYRLLGPLDSPTLQMNPLSAIAPGIFRKIFEYR